MNRALLVLSLGCFVGSMSMIGCAANSDAADDSADDSADITAAAATDSVAIANAEKVVDAKIYLNGHGMDTASSLEVRYSALPAKLAKQLESDNPGAPFPYGPVDGSGNNVSRAYRIDVKNAKGVSTHVFVVMDGFSDEGESDTIYTTRGKALVTGTTYRSPDGKPVW